MWNGDQQTNSFYSFLTGRIKTSINSVPIAFRMLVSYYSSSFYTHNANRRVLVVVKIEMLRQREAHAVMNPSPGSTSSHTRRDSNKSETNTLSGSLRWVGPHLTQCMYIMYLLYATNRYRRLNNMNNIIQRKGSIIVTQYASFGGIIMIVI